VLDSSKLSVYPVYAAVRVCVTELTNDPEDDDDLELVDDGRGRSKVGLQSVHVAWSRCQRHFTVVSVTGPWRRQVVVVVVVVVGVDKVECIGDVVVRAERGQREQRQEEHVRDGVRDELGHWTAKFRRDLSSTIRTCISLHTLFKLIRVYISCSKRI